jgi:hypothetical protein
MFNRLNSKADGFAFQQSFETGTTLQTSKSCLTPRLAWFLTRCPTVLASLLLALAPALSHASDRSFQAGAYAIDVTPTNWPVIINGNFLAATASSARDPLHARCLVLDDGANRVGLCVIDTCVVPREFADEAKRLIQEATGLRADRILISATHTHSAPSLMQTLGTPPDPHYPEFLLDRLVEGFQRAVGQLAPARVGWSSTPAPDHTHTRVWIRRPDRVETNPFGERTVRANMHPGYVNPDVIGPSGPSDPELSLISIRSVSGRPIALLASYAMHYFGSTAVSADYFGIFASELERLFEAQEGDPPFVGMMFQGFSGDQHWMDYSKPQKSVTMEVYARELAQLAHAASEEMIHHKWAPIQMRDLDLPLPVRMPNEQRLSWAREVVDGMQGRLPQTLPEVYAAEQLWLEANPTRDVKLQVLRLGDLGMTAVSGEVFAITSLKIKAQSPLQPMINIGLANGEEGYLPPPEHHPLGSYNTWACRTACLDPQAEPKIVDALLGMLEEISGHTRRPLLDSHGPYADRVLKAEPLAYWRMNEFGGPCALDSTRNDRPATYEDGMAFYLEGPQSPAFSGPREINRAPHFAGGRMTAPIALPSEQYSVEMWFWNGLPHQVRGVTGHLFAWGDALSIGGTDGAPGRLLLAAGPGRTLFTGRAELPLKTWTHLVFTRDRQRVTVYLNGKPEISGQAPLFDPGEVRTLFIGGSEAGDATFEGKLDEVSVYDRPLGAAEVLRHFREAGLGSSTAAIDRVEPDPLGPYSVAVLDSGPLAYWRMGENGFYGRCALDLTGRRLDGTYEEGIELYQTGPSCHGLTGGKGANHAPRFSGGRMRATARGLGQNYSVSFWFWNNRLNNERLVTGYLFSRGPNGESGAPGDHLGISGTHVQNAGRLFFFNGNALNQVLAGRTEIAPRTWNHVLLVRDGKSVTAYLNGNPEPEFAGTIEISSGAHVEEVFFGGRSDNFSNLDGKLDEVALYNRAISAGEVRRLFERAISASTEPSS